jgi:hypothetical protein
VISSGTAASAVIFGATAEGGCATRFSRSPSPVDLDEQELSKPSETEKTP